MIWNVKQVLFLVVWVSDEDKLTILDIVIIIISERS